MSLIRALVVDDSAVVRQAISAVLAASGAVEVVAAVADPLFAMQRMRLAWPDVIVLDIEMPRMDGITFLRRIMAQRPTPVVICSTLTARGAETTMQALAAGAFAIIAKPRLGARDFLLDPSSNLVEVVKAAARSNAANLRREPVTGIAEPAGLSGDTADEAAMRVTTDRVVAIGTSTGGTQALETVLSSLPKLCPGILVVQHMPEKFTAAFAERLDSVSRIAVKEARTGDRLLPGCAFIAPGGRHMTLKRSGAQYLVEVKDGPPVNRHRPSVDVLFGSVARHAGANSLGIIMTGMGDDGARGLAQMREAGARTLAQDEESSVVFGMPAEAIKRGAVERVLALEAIAGEIAAFGPG